MPKQAKNPRTAQLNLRISPQELTAIDALKEKLNKTSSWWEQKSRIDVIVMAIDYATGGMFPND